MKTRPLPTMSPKQLKALPSISCISMDQEDPDDATLPSSEEDVEIELRKEHGLLGEPSRHGLHIQNISDMLCCSLTNDEKNVRAMAADIPFTEVNIGCSGCFSVWTTETKSALQQSVLDFLSLQSQPEEKPRRTTSGKEAFENKYWSMVQDRLVCLEDSLSKEELARKEENERNSNKVFRTDMGSPRTRFNRMRRLRRKMSLEPSLDDVILSDVERTKIQKAHSMDEQRMPTPLTRKIAREQRQDFGPGGLLLRGIVPDCYCGHLSQVHTAPTIPEMTASFAHHGLHAYPDDGYDSDPETLMRRKTTNRKTKRSMSSIGPTIASHIVHETCCDDEDCDEGECNEEEDEEGNALNELSLVQVSQESSFESFKYQDRYAPNLADRSDVDIFDDDQVAQLTRDFTNCTMTLIWHPPQLAKGRTDSPTCVKAWIELGCRLKSRIIQPKLVWRHAYNMAEEDPTQPRSRSILGTSPEALGQVDLLDIARILTPQSCNRNEFPFAKLSKSFMVITSDRRTLLFEVAEESELHRIVSSLKLLVARLASMIIVGDPQLFKDFFYISTPIGATKKRNWVFD